MTPPSTTVGSGLVWVALLVNATGAPNIASGEANAAIKNLGLSPASYRWPWRAPG